MCSAIRLSQKLPLLQLLQKENNLKTLSPAHAFSFLVKGKTKNPPRTSGRYVPVGGVLIHTNIGTVQCTIDGNIAHRAYEWIMAQQAVATDSIRFDSI